MLYVVQSVPHRREIRERLLVDLPPAVVIEDEGEPPPNPWRGYRRCIKAFLDSGESHGVLIQDDTTVCQNFTPAVELISQAHPDSVVCLFVSAARTKTLREYVRASRSGRRYATIWFQDYLPVVATLWPKSQAARFLHWTESDDFRTPGMPNPRSDDAVAGSWMKFTRQKVLATIPSLVQHPDDTPSVKWGAESRVPSGTGNKGRRAFNYIGDEDPLELDWGL